jgi:hypothetical protein
MNLFRQTPDKSLDKQYLRICAVYRLFVSRRAIDKARAVELLAQRHVSKPSALVELSTTTYDYRRAVRT